MKALMIHFWYHGQWATNILVPCLCVLLIAVLRKRVRLGGPTLYAANAVLVFFGILVLLSVVDLMTAEAFEYPPLAAVAAMISAFPVLILCDLVRSERGAVLVVSHFLVPSGMAIWGLVGWVVGASAYSLFQTGTQKTAQPGATDNPDDAQRLREDH